MTRKLVEQMLDCIDELKYSNDTFTSQFKSNASITAAREYLAQPESEARTEQSEQKPYAYEIQSAMCEAELSYSKGGIKSLIKPLYTQPKAPEPLTDEEIYAAIRPFYKEEYAARMSFEVGLEEFRAVLAAQRSKEMSKAWEHPKFNSLYEQVLWAGEMKTKFIGPPKPPKEKVVQHAIYPYLGTSDRQRAYLVKHGIKHVRKDGEYR